MSLAWFSLVSSVRKGVDEKKLEREIGTRSGRDLKTRLKMLDLVVCAVEMRRGEAGTL